MKKTILLTLALIATSMSLSAQHLWKVTGNGAKGTSYLFGTHHVAPISILDGIKGFDQAIREVDAVYGEVEMARTMADSAKVQQIMMTYAMAPADSTLTKVLTPVQIDSVDAVLSKYLGGLMSVASLDQLKPNMVATTLAQIYSMVAFPGYDPSQQLDQVIQKRVVELGKPSKGLETYEYQFQLMLGDPISVQVVSLMESIALDEKAIPAAQRLARAYESGDLDKISVEFNDPEMGIDPEYAERIVYVRNRAWVEQLKQIMPSESVLVAVGIGHFIGDQGLINLLRQAGYTVEPVR